MTTPRRLELDDRRRDVCVIRSGFWGYNGIGVGVGDVACVVDPGIEPKDIDLLRESLDRVHASDGSR